MATREEGAMKKLTETQRTMLRDIERICGECDGYAPHGAGQWCTIRALERAGLVRDDGPCECADGCERAGDCPHDVTGFVLTEAGRLALEDDHGDA